MVQITRAEEEAVWYAESVNWDYNKICEYIFNNMHHTRYSELIGNTANEKAHYIINKFKPKMETKTKVTVLGEEPKKELKRIEFIFSVRADEVSRHKITNTQTPSSWDNVVLLCRKYNLTNLDLMAASDDNSDNFCLFLGHWNDGIV